MITNRKWADCEDLIMQNVGESKAVADEFALRVASLRERDSTRAWRFF
jgi:hypothetical protein